MEPISNEGIEQFDKKLQELEGELKDLNQKYGFEKFETFGKGAQIKNNEEEGPGAPPEPEKLTVKPSESGYVMGHLAPQIIKAATARIKNGPMQERYGNLPKIDANLDSAMQKPATKKAISEKWVAELKSAPNLESLYDKQYYEPEFTDIDKLKIQARLVGGVDLLSAEIDKYANEYTNS